MQKIKMRDFISKTLNIDPLDLKEESDVDISDKEIKILSYDMSLKKDVYMKVNRIIRKKDTFKYIIETDNHNVECTLDHKSYVCLNNDNNKCLFLTTEEILLSMDNNEILLKTISGYEKINNIIKTKEVIPIFDLEIDNTHNFYTNEILSHNSFGNPITTSGGQAIAFYSHVRIWITRSKIDAETGQNVVKFNFVKNKMGLPYKVGQCVYDWNKGFDRDSEIVAIAESAGIIIKKGNTYTLPEVDPDIKLSSKKKLMEYLENNPDYIKQVISPLVEEYLNNKSEIVEEATSE